MCRHVLRMVGVAIVGVLLLASVSAPAEAPCKATTTTDAKGLRIVVLENAYLRVVVRPSSGGVVTSLVHKRTGHEYVGATQGFFVDLDWSFKRQAQNDYQKQDYVFEVTENTPERVSVMLQGKSRIPPLDWIVVGKTLALTRGSSAIRASYRYFNHPDSMDTITVRPWIHHEGEGLGGLGASYVMPLTTGLHTIRPVKGRTESKYGTEVAQGWLGVFMPGGNGMVCFPNYKDAYQYYEWVSEAVSTLEWRLRPLEIPNGKSFETSYLMLPFAGLHDLCGGARGVVCGMPLPKDPDLGKPVTCEVELVSAQALKDVRVDARVRHLADGVWKNLGQKTCALQPDSPVKIAIGSWTPDRQGTWVVQCRVSQAGERILDAERTMVFGKGTDGYELAAEGTRGLDSNLVSDPSAEWDTKGLWKLNMAALDDTVSHSGRVCVRAECINHPTNRSIVGRRRIPVEPKTKYLVSFWAKCQSARNFRINVTDLDANRKPIPVKRRRCEVHFKGRSRQWVRHQVPFQSLPDAKFVDINIYGFGENVLFWVDDLRMVPGEPVVAVHPAQTDIACTLDVETPHVKWARPYARGPVKAFLLAHYLSARDIIELAQRLDMDFQTVTWSGSKLYCRYASATMYGRRRMDDEIRNIREKLAQKYDVIVLGGIPWKWFPEKVRKTILKQVNEGTGLVYVQPNWLLDDLLKPEGTAFPMRFPGRRGYAQVREPLAPYKVKEHAITTGMPLRALMPMRYGRWYKEKGGEDLAMYNKNNPMLSVGQFGRGRVVALNYVTGSWPYREDPATATRGRAWQRNGLFPMLQTGKDFDPAAIKYHYWEYHWALLARATAWAAHKEPEVAVTAVDPDAGLQELAQGPRDAVSISLQSPGATSATLEATFLDEYSVGLGTLKQTVALEANAAKTFSFRVPKNIPAGLIFAEFILRDATGRSLNWAVTAFENPKPARIEAIELDRENRVYRRGEKVAASVKLSGRLAGASLFIEVVDTWDRLILKRSLAVEGPEVPVAVALAHPRSVRMGIRATLLQAGRIVDRAETRFTISPDKSPWDQYQFTISGIRATRPYLYDAIFAHYARYGFTCVRGYDAFANADRNFNFLASLGNHFHKMPDQARASRSAYQQTGDLKHLQRHPPAYDPKAWDRHMNGAESAGRRYAQVVPLIYGLGDENNIGGAECDYDYAPTTLAWFRDWLKEQYKDLAALNRQWETTFAKWQDVMPLPLDQARKRGENLSPWADHREFMDHVFAEFHARMKAAVQRGDPNAVIGVSGTQRPGAYNGYDWWRLMKVFDALLAYSGGNQPEIQRSFKRVPSVGWAGYGRTGPGTNYQFWNYLLYNKTVSLWRDTVVFEPDWRPSQSARDYAAAARPLVRGIGKLIMQSEWVPDAVGIHYSQASIRAAAGTRRASAFDRTRASWVTLVQDLGLQPLFISYEQVERGVLTPQRVRIFILPESEAISAKEAEQLRAYVNAGGVLLADTRTALRDEHCRLLPAARLDDLFGFQRGAPPDGRPPRVIELRDADWIKWPHKRLLVSVADTGAGIRPTTGRALGASRGVPSIICRQVGRGRTVYLNFHSTAYPRAVDEGVRFRDNLRALLAGAGVTGRTGVTDANGQPFFGCQVTHFRNGSELMVALLADRAYFSAMAWDEREARVRPAHAANLGRLPHVYEVVTGKSLGRVEEVRCVLPSSEMRILAFLPGKVTGVQIDGPASARAGEVINFTIAVQARPALRDRQLVRIQVTGPDGNPRRACSTIAWIPAAGGAHVVPLALNDATGPWRVRVTHVVSGLATERGFTVAAPGP